MRRGSSGPGPAQSGAIGLAQRAVGTQHGMRQTQERPMEDAGQTDLGASDAERLLDQLGAEIGSAGFQRRLDTLHSASYIARGPVLIVSFEKIAVTLAQPGSGLPLSLDFAEDKNWSVLHFAADGDTWFRSEAVYAFVDELVDDAFFEGFDTVVFYGSNMGAYAAAAFSVAAPGARVVAISPQATLDRSIAEWDTRFPRSRNLTFTDRYGYAPHMLDAAEAAFVLYDPHALLDCVHASLFRSDNVTRLKCRFFGSEIAPLLKDMDVLHTLVQDAAEGRLTPTGFYAMLRRRRKHGRYLRNLMFHLDDAHRPGLMLLLSGHVLTRMAAPAFRRRYDAARQSLKDRGTLPDWAVPGVERASRKRP